MVKARQIASILDTELDNTTHDPITEHEESYEPTQEHSSLDAFYRHHPLRLVVDSGATGNMIRLSTRLDSFRARATTAYDPWPKPSIVHSVAGKIRLPNLSSYPQSLKRNEHFVQASPVFEPSTSNEPAPVTPKAIPTKPAKCIGKHSDKVQLDPDNLLPQDIKSKFRTLLLLSKDTTGQQAHSKPKSTWDQSNRPMRCYTKFISIRHTNPQGLPHTIPWFICTRNAYAARPVLKPSNTSI